MKDLVPKGTGNSRFLRSSIPADITHQELVALLRAGTFPVDFAGLNADGVAVVGSAYNKANVLPDTTCEKLEIPTTAEPRDAFLVKKWHEYERITTSKKFVVPEGVYHIGVFAQGGGQSGSACAGNAYRIWGGASGYVNCAILDVTPGQSINITIGSGGNPVTSKYFSSATMGSPGGDTIVGDDLIAWGGASKNAADYKSDLGTYDPPRGYTMPVLESGQNAKSGLYMFSETGILSINPQRAYNIFDPNMLIGSAGSSVYNDGSGVIDTNTPTPCDLGIGGASSVKTGSANITASSATGNGCGGGAAYLYDSTSRTTATSGAGSPGIVIIYV